MSEQEKVSMELFIVVMKLFQAADLDPASEMATVGALTGAIISKNVNSEDFNEAVKVLSDGLVQHKELISKLESSMPQQSPKGFSGFHQ